MAVLKCPKCGRLCRTGLVPFPRCARCHEHLLKCRYCADYNARMLDCVSTFRPEDFHIRDPDLYLACPHHRTTLALTEGQVVRRRVWVPALGALVIAVVAVFAVARFQATPTKGPTLHARFVPVQEAILQEPTLIQVQIWNPGPGRVNDVIMGIHRSYERHLKLTSVEPEPVTQRRTRQWERFWFPGLGEGETLEVWLHVVPVKQGVWRFRAEVTSPDVPRREQLSTKVEISP
jgi:hypothetical protein